MDDTKEQNRQYAKVRRARVRSAILKMFGECCTKCGYNKDLRALQLDHINRAKVPRKHWLRSGHDLYKRVLAGIFPAEEFQLLCANCNWIKKLENKEYFPVTTSAGI